MRENVFSRVVKVVSYELSVELYSITIDTKFADLGADSLDVASLCLAFEDEFKMDIPKNAAEWKTIRDAMEYINRN